MLRLTKINSWLKMQINKLCKKFQSSVFLLNCYLFYLYSTFIYLTRVDYVFFFFFRHELISLSFPNDYLENHFESTVPLFHERQTNKIILDQPYCCNQQYILQQFELGSLDSLFSIRCIGKQDLTIVSEPLLCVIPNHLSSIKHITRKWFQTLYTLVSLITTSHPKHWSGSDASASGQFW